MSKEKSLSDSKAHSDIMSGIAKDYEIEINYKRIELDPV